MRKLFPFMNFYRNRSTVRWFENHRLYGQPDFVDSEHDRYQVDSGQASGLQLGRVGGTVRWGHVAQSVHTAKTSSHSSRMGGGETMHVISCRPLAMSVVMRPVLLMRTCCVCPISAVGSITQLRSPVCAGGPERTALAV